jgi:hypothetical protein
VRSHDNGANPRACPPPNPTGNPWLDRANEAMRLAEDARGTGHPALSLAAALLAAQYIQLAKLRGGAP